MFDAYLRDYIDPPLNRAGRKLAQRGWTANQVTSIGFLIGITSIPLIAMGCFKLALLAVLLNRLCDGLDGAVARATVLRDAGGYLDIVLDFVFYAALPLGFALYAPASNGLVAAFLLFSYMGSTSSFLAFAIMAAKRGLETEAQGKKSIFYLQGLTEGFETIAFMVFCLLFPGWFALLAFIYACMCLITTATRIWTSYQRLSF